MSDSESKPEAVFEEVRPDGFVYREENTEGRFPTRLCTLHSPDDPSPVSWAKLVSFSIRFGSASVQAEGYANVNTAVPYRRKGHGARLFETSLQRAVQRSPCLFLYGIEGYYEPFGFVSCLNETTTTLAVRRFPEVDTGELLPHLAANELPQLIELFNQTHASRPWTLVREPGWHRLRPGGSDQPASQVAVLRNGSTVRGYAVFDAQTYGWDQGHRVLEMAAGDLEAARRLLLDAARRAFALRREAFTVSEPADTVVGLAARSFGCETTQRSSATGGGMAAITQREALITALTPELTRRAGSARLDLPGTLETAIAELATRHAVPADDALIRLLLGYWSSRDARALGVDFGSLPTDVADAMFPGQSETLPTGFAHRLDRY